MKVILKYFLIFILLTVIHSISDDCKKDEDCLDLNFCVEQSLGDKVEQKCKHKKVFPITPVEIVGLFGIVLGSALSNAGGIGGGGLLIPLLILVLNFYTHEAIPISKLMIFAGAVTSFILGFRQKHPFRNAITIDYNIPFLLVPMLLFGTMVGVTLNKVTPPWLILLNLTLILVINTYKTMKKGMELYKKEKKETRDLQKTDIELKGEVQRDGYNALGELEDVTKDTGKLDVNKSLEESKKSETTTNNFIINPSSEALKKEETKDLVKFPLRKISYMIGSFIIMLTITLLKGSNYNKSLIGIESCSALYWLIYLIYLPIALGLTYMISRDIKSEYNYRLSIGYPYNIKHDVVWSDSIFIKYPIYSFISGVMAGLLGIGGGLIIGPLLLELGMHPLVSTATSNFMVLFTSSSTSIQFIIFGMMNYDYGLVSTICSSIGSFVGTLIIQKIVEKTKKVSLLVLVLGAVLGVSTLLIPSYTLYTTIEQLKEGKNIWVFNSPC